MSLDAELTPLVVAACRQNAGETVEALSRALDRKFELAADSISPLAGVDQPADWNGPGLAIVLQVANESFVGFLAASSGVLPDWYKTPDATGSSKLTTLAQELGMLLLPESHMPEDFKAGYIENFTAALTRSACNADGGIEIPLSADGRKGTLYLLWPATKAELIFAVPAAPAGESPARPAAPPAVEASEDEFAAALLKLPPYIRSLLQIRVAVAVELASRPQPVSRIVNMGPGSIIQFDRQCEQPLELYVNNLKIGEGEVVKVGDKFGLRITSITLPGERFLPMQLLGRRAAS